MLFLFLAAICLVSVILIGRKECSDFSRIQISLITVFMLILLLGIVVFAVMGFFASSHEYGEPVYLECRELVSLDKDQTYYLAITNYNQEVRYSYDKVITSTYHTEYVIPNDEKIETKDGNMEIEYIPETETPIVEVYFQDRKSNIWTFSFGNNRYYYLFKVPQGTVFNTDTLIP